MGAAAATLFDAVGSDYRRYLPAADPLVLECAYAETGKPDKAIPQLRFYVQNADPGQDADEAEKVIESRFLVAQMLAASGDPDAQRPNCGRCGRCWPAPSARTPPKSATSTSRSVDCARVRRLDNC